MDAPTYSAADVAPLLQGADWGQLILIGGQSLNTWQSRYAKSHPHILTVGPSASPDLDFVGSYKAAESFAKAAGATEAPLAAPMSETVHVATVTVTVGDRPVSVDFIRYVKGVADDVLRRHTVDLTSPDGSGTIRLIDPIACLLSRLANINGLGRHDLHPVGQAKLALELANIYIDDLLNQQATKLAQNYLLEIEGITKQWHIGKYTHVELGVVIDPPVIQASYLDDERLDARWRAKVLTRSIERSQRKMLSFEKRYSERMTRQAHIQTPHERLVV